VIRDYLTVQASILILATAYVVVNLFVDIIYRLLNPCVQLA
jgi:ABC-type dipeptide/oligopeptide/nickel transport system permease component